MVLGWTPYTSEYGFTDLTSGMDDEKLTFNISLTDLCLEPLRMPFMVADARCQTAAGGILMVVDLDGCGVLQWTLVTLASPGTRLG